MTRRSGWRRRVGAGAVATATAMGMAVVTGACSGGDGRAATATSAGATTTTAAFAAAAATTLPVPPVTVAPTAPAPAPMSPAGAAVSSTGPQSPAEAIADLRAAETGIRDPATPATEVADLGERAQAAYRALASHPEWTSAVIAGVPDAIREAVRANARAVAELRAIPVTLRDGPPAWRIVPPAPAADLLQDYKDAAAATGVDWQVLAAIHLVETRMGRIRGTSTAGAQGPMQFLPATWRQYGGGGDIQNDRDAIFGAARLLRANGAPADTAKAVFSYNHSQHYVNAVLGFASVMRTDERAYFGFHGWQVHYRTKTDDLLLPEGFGG